MGEGGTGAPPRVSGGRLRDIYIYIQGILSNIQGHFYPKQLTVSSSVRRKRNNLW